MSGELLGVFAGWEAREFERLLTLEPGFWKDGVRWICRPSTPVDMQKIRQRTSEWRFVPGQRCYSFDRVGKER